MSNVAMKYITYQDSNTDITVSAFSIIYHPIMAWRPKAKPRLRDSQRRIIRN